MNTNRLETIFSDLKASGQKTVLPFLTAGYPSLPATGAMLHALEARGTRICELGVPFSDPVADGPTIQASYTAALEAGVTVAGIFSMVRDYRAAGGSMALLAMVSYSIVFKLGPQQFCAQAADAGLDGLIVPDLSLDEAGDFIEIAKQAGLCNVLLISPTTPDARRAEIAKASTGFVYFMSVAGITGERITLPPETIDAVAALKTHTDTPICVGFGISSPDMVEAVCQVAAGAIVGSAIIHKINDAVAQNAPQDQLVETVADFVAELLAPVQ